MNLLRVLALMGIATLAGTSSTPVVAQPDGGDDPSEWKGKALVVVLSGDVGSDARTGRELERLLKAAAGAEISTLVLEIDMSDPATWDSQRHVLDLPVQIEAPTVAYINATATGPGALFALAADSIYLDPNGIVGGAGIRKAETKEGQRDENFIREQSILTPCAGRPRRAAG